MFLLAPSLAFAGLLAAAGPVVIHLLNRRRFRQVEWAAMEFLLEAMKRSKRVLELRDILLLLLRTACLVLFGLALARPHFSTTATDVSSGQPVHAVFIVDNSLSMGYRAFNTTLLEEAKGRVGELIERLPQGSRFTVLPLCGSANAYSHDAYRTVQDARDALQRIEVVDRTGTAALAVDLAVEACATVPELPTKRVLLVGDQQRNNWPKDVLAGRGDKLPELQIVSVTAESPENAWISEFKLQDGVADIETPAILLGTIRYDGAEPRKNVQVTLTIDGNPVSTRSVDLEPGQSREVQFTHEFDLPIAPGQTGFVPAMLTLSPDHLPQDDQRFLSIPVVAALPVVFVDQYGPLESPQENKLGETLPLRRLLAPISRGDTNRQLVQIRHVALDDLTQEVLQEARMVVVAGLEKPGAAVPLLKEYALQGGQVVLAAGAEFDPKAWSDEAWLDGAGLLPLPLKPQTLGKIPEETSGTLEPFFLNPASMTSADFYLEATSKEELEDLYRLPLFFKTVVPEPGDETVQQVVKAATARIIDERAQKAERDKAVDKSAADKTATDANRWLRWEVTEGDADSRVAPEQLANRERPLVLASFGNQVPYLVERRLGRGSVLFVSSGFQSNWNNLIKTNAVLVFDQLLRTRLSRTIPERTLLTQGERVLPVPAADRRATFELERPSGTRETLTVDALGPDHYGLTLRDLLQRGIYQITATVPAKPKAAGAAADVDGTVGEKLWEMPLAVNGLSSESELATLNAGELAERAGDLKYRWLSPGQSLSLEGTEVAGMNLWVGLMIAVLLCLLAEMAVLAWPTHSSREVVA